MLGLVNLFKGILKSDICESCKTDHYLLPEPSNDNILLVLDWLSILEISKDESVKYELSNILINENTPDAFTDTNLVVFD